MDDIGIATDCLLKPASPGGELTIKNVGGRTGGGCTRCVGLVKRIRSDTLLEMG